MTVVRDIVGPIFPRMNSLKSLKAMLGKEPTSGLAATCGMNNNARGNGAPIKMKTIKWQDQNQYFQQKKFQVTTK